MMLFCCIDNVMKLAVVPFYYILIVPVCRNVGTKIFKECGLLDPGGTASLYFMCSTDIVCRIWDMTRWQD